MSLIEREKEKRRARDARAREKIYLKHLRWKCFFQKFLERIFFIRKKFEILLKVMTRRVISILRRKSSISKIQQRARI